MGKGRKPEKIIKPISKLPFEITFDFVIGKSDKYRNDKNVIKTLKQEKSDIEKNTK